MVRGALTLALGPALFGLGVFGFQQAAPDEEQAPREVKLGGVMTPKERFTARRVDLGRDMFAIRWTPDEGALFNERACMRCHMEPAIGGGRPPMAATVLMVPAPNTPGGTSNARRLRFKNGQAVSQILPENTTPRKSPALFGLGLLETIPDASLLAKADPSDKDGDGISGWMPRRKDGLGRFGWKSTFATLDSFVLDAFEVELGQQKHSPEAGDTRSIDQNQIDATTIFIRYLNAPPTIPRKGRGADLFRQLDCAKCHTPEWRTGPNSKFPELANRTIRPYTDMLLHHMGEGDLHDQGALDLREVRTPQLWGVSHVGPPYLHDESASTLEEAVLGHGGEGASSRDRFKALSASDRGELIRYLESL